MLQPGNSLQAVSYDNCRLHLLLFSWELLSFAASCSVFETSYIFFLGVLFVSYVITAERVRPISVILCWPEAQARRYIFKQDKGRHESMNGTSNGEKVFYKIRII